MVVLDWISVIPKVYIAINCVVYIYSFGSIVLNNLLI